MPLRQIDVQQRDIVLRDWPSEDVVLQVKLRLRLDKPADTEAPKMCTPRRGSPAKSDLAKLACSLYDSRRARERVFDAELFGEPAWDMLLALYALPSRGETMTITSLTYAALVPDTTGHRWQALLRSAGLIERSAQGVDGRKQIVRLTFAGQSLMEKYLTKLFCCEIPVTQDTVATSESGQAHQAH